jgi:fucose 4-O-acetylase-like acetyltransferase
MRVSHLDIVRAICILLVVLGHSTIGHSHGPLNAVLASFRMPLFFLLSGTFFKPDAGLRETFIRKGDSLIKPYLTLAILYAPYYLLKGHGSPTEYIRGVLSVSGLDLPGWLFPMWFLLLLWATYVFGVVFVRVSGFAQRPKFWQFAWIAALLAFGYLTINVLWMRTITLGPYSWQLTGLPFNLDLLPLAGAFFLTGYILRKEIHTREPGWLLTAAALLVFALLHLVVHPSMSMLMRQYTHAIASPAAAFSGSLLLFKLAHRMAALPLLATSLRHIGRQGLYLLMFHAPILSLVGKAIHAGLQQTPIVAESLAMVITICITLLVARLIEAQAWLRLCFKPFPRSAQTRSSRDAGHVAVSTPQRSGGHEVREAA